MRILIFEAYDGGSHSQFLDGLIEASSHECIRIGLPARKWKWRMRGSGIYFARQVQKTPIVANDVDVIFTSDMTPVADMRALLGEQWATVPIVCYFHENQLTYPVSAEDDRDYQFGFTNITSCLASDEVWFNSQYHLKSFLQAVDWLLRKMPDHAPTGIADDIEKRSRVMPLGLDNDLFDAVAGAFESKRSNNTPVTVLWNHRWEYDKNPDDFFEMLFDLERSGTDFRLIVAGQSFRESPAIFAAAQKALAGRIDHFGYAGDRRDYLKLLKRSDVVVSTAVHEFFGLSVLEAIAMGCYPILPNRLSYPELLGLEVRDEYLYENVNELREKLRMLCRDGVPSIRKELSSRVASLCWKKLVNRYDEAFERVCRK